MAQLRTQNTNSNAATDLLAPTPAPLNTVSGYTPEQIELIKNTVAKGTSDNELALFLTMAQSSGLDPFRRQIYAIMRGTREQVNGQWTYVQRMVVQVAIDGLRLIADRTERYVPGQATMYEHDESGNLHSATAYVKKLVAGVWHEYGATAFWSEYAQTKKDGGPTEMWAKMPKVMLGKCAEALALRRGFPGETSGYYTHDEMGQADNDPRPAIEVLPVAPSTPRRPQLTVDAAPMLAARPSTSPGAIAATAANERERMLAGIDKVWGLLGTEYGVRPSIDRDDLAAMSVGELKELGRAEKAYLADLRNGVATVPVDAPPATETTPAPVDGLYDGNGEPLLVFGVDAVVDEGGDLFPEDATTE